MSIQRSTREELIKAIRSTLESIGDIKTVVRRLPSDEQWRSFANTQFPIVAMVAALPTPNEKESARYQGRLDLIVSDLRIDLFTAFFCDEDDEVDETLSGFLNTLWAALYADPTIGNRALGIKLKPELYSSYSKPYGVFLLTAYVRYVHTTTEI